MTIQEYIDKVNKRYKTGISTEHSYRGDLLNLLESLTPNVNITNEPSRIACGAPDYIITKGKIPIGIIEAKDIGKPLDSKDYKEQFDRYKKGFENLIITDYLTFKLFRDGTHVLSVSIAKILDGKIIPNPARFDSFTDLINDFCTFIGTTIKSASKLSRMMAGKARLLANVIENALNQDEEAENEIYEVANITLREQLEAFKNVLIHDISPKDFADIYAQTIAYGMFAARFHDPSIEDFTRQEAAELIPKSNPFLRKLFQYIAGYDLDDRIKWIVDALADIFRATDVAALLKDFGKTTQQNDPMIHFYETFLAEYDPKLRKSRGVYYTPEPVVNFIVRAVDDILKTEFGLAQGLADTSQVEIEVEDQGADKRINDVKKKIKEKVHKVQILDPAAGTGTFLAEVVKQIYHKFERQQGIWSKYVEDHLIPRLHGFELLMAPYAMAHLKLELLLCETGYKPKRNQRLQVYLTNSLEEHHPDTGTLFANWLSSEANEANEIKNDIPVMVVLGNPPYSGISSNMGEWIVNLIEDYKYVEGQHFREKKHWLHDDYVKFIRYGQHFIEKNGEGILAFINNHGFIDNPTFRGMRWHLLVCFDKIYIIDLHGNTMKKETPPNGLNDKNVFDIQQGVSINIFIKTGKKKSKELAEVMHFDCWGERNIKYNFLLRNDFRSIKYSKIEYQKPFYFFVPKDYELINKYNLGFSLNDLFTINVTGVVTARDSFVIDFEEEQLLKRIKRFINPDISDEEMRSEFFGNESEGKYPPGDSRSWKMIEARLKIKNYNHIEKIRKILYRPFDSRFIYYDPSMVDWGREKVMPHIFPDENIGIVFPRQAITDNWSHIQVCNEMIDNRIHYSNKGIPIFAPLYLYQINKNQKVITNAENRIPNFNNEIISFISEKLNSSFTSEKKEELNTHAPIDILDYIYAILHSPKYREKYKEFLKIDFPRVPYPRDKKMFWQLVKLGSELRQIHLLESPLVEQYITSYPQDGNNKVDKVKYEDRKVWINDEQYFDKVPQIAWEFYIGGYQPAQKWLKDRKGRTLSFEDIMHYQKIIVALTETDRIMKEIDKIDFLK